MENGFNGEPVEIIENKRIKMTDLAAYESHSENEEEEEERKENKTTKKNEQNRKNRHTHKQSLATHRYSHFRIRNAKLFHIVEALSGLHSNVKRKSKKKNKAQWQQQTEAHIEKC